MKSKINEKTPNKGFTLIEILVVVAIIATLAAISIPIMTKVFATALDTKATSQMKQFVQGCDDFREDHDSSSFGAITAATDGGDTVVKTGIDTEDILEGSSGEFERYLLLLSGKGVDSVDQSLTGKNYIKLPEATDEGREGLIFDSAGVPVAFADPWGFAYSLVFDTNFDDQILLTDTENLGDFSGVTIGLNGGNVLMLSGGRDMAFGGGRDLKSN